MGEGADGTRRNDAERVAELERRLGCRFADPARVLSALTHKSYVNEHREQPGEDNERLEFLGDAVVDLLVSHRLMERFPTAREGPLSKMRAAVVDEPGLAAMARALGLGELLRLGRGEELTGGREKASLLADAMEAVIAAVYLEGGVGAAQAVVDRFLEDAFRRATDGTLDRDYKTQLQESCQARFRMAPRYRVVGESGPDHSKIFEVEVLVRGEPLGRGAGRSKKDAEQLAAREALEALARRPASADLEPPGVAASPPGPAATVPEPAPGGDAGGAVVEPAPSPSPVPEAPVPAVAAQPEVPARPSPPPRRRPSRKVTIAPARRTPSPRKAPARKAGRPRKPHKGPRGGKARGAPRR